MLRETVFLMTERFGDQRLGACELRKRLSHLRHKHGNKAEHDGIPATKDVHVAHGTAHDPAEDITASLIGREDPVGHQEAGGAQVVGDHVERRTRLTFGPCTDEVFARVDDRGEEIGIEVALDALENRRHAL